MQDKGQPIQFVEAQRLILIFRLMQHMEQLDNQRHLLDVQLPSPKFPQRFCYEPFLRSSFVGDRDLCSGSSGVHPHDANGWVTQTWLPSESVEPTIPLATQVTSVLDVKCLLPSSSAIVAGSAAPAVEQAVSSPRSVLSTNSLGCAVSAPFVHTQTQLEHLGGSWEKESSVALMDLQEDMRPPVVTVAPEIQPQVTYLIPSPFSPSLYPHKLSTTSDVDFFPSLADKWQGTAFAASQQVASALRQRLQ